jgi:hypothetical protein
MTLSQTPISPILPGDTGLSVRTRLNEAFTRLVSAITQINTLTNEVNGLDLTSVLTRVEQLENDAASLLSSVTAVENGVAALDSRLTTAEANIAGLDTRLDTAEADIAGLNTRLSTAEADIAGLDTRLDTAEADITDIETDFAALNTRLTDVEGAYVARSPRTVVVSGTAYTLAAADMAGDTVVVCTSSSPTTVTVAPDLPSGTVSIYRQGTGAVTIAPGTGVTINSASGLGLRVQHSAASLVRVAAANTYFAAGDLTT